MKIYLRASKILVILSIVFFLLGILFTFVGNESDLFGFIGFYIIFLSILLMIVSLNLFISYLISYKTARRFKDSYMLHNEIEYTIENRQIRFINKNIIILASHIKSVKMEVNHQVVYSSGIGEAIVGGVLFGGSGAIAGSIVGSRPKKSTKAVIYIETDLIQHSGIAIKTTQLKGYEICKVLEALID